MSNAQCRADGRPKGCDPSISAVEPITRYVKNANGSPPRRWLKPPWYGARPTESSYFFIGSCSGILRDVAGAWPLVAMLVGDRLAAPIL